MAQNAPPDTPEMLGTYRGRAVKIRRGEKRDAEHGTGYNFFIELSGVHGSAGWKIAWRPILSVFGMGGADVTADAREIRGRVQAAGAVGLIEEIGITSVTHVSFDPRRSALVWNEDVRPRLAPTPERFVQQLDVLLRLDAVNQQIQHPRV